MSQVFESTEINLYECADHVLVQKCLGNDQTAFETLVQRYRPMLFNFVYRIVGDYDQTCDILQHVFIQLFISLSTLKAGKSMRGWLFQVARNRSLDELRKRRAIHFSTLEAGEDDDEVSVLAALRDPNALPDEVAERHDLQESLRQAITSLPPKYRLVVFRRYARQESFAEIGKALSMPEATAKTYFQRAKPLLRAQLSQTILH
ncbi:MAG TPA: RNA polymerase sigma factor [Ktedonobacteraceae bacterium]|nr:RNA polymerase sigma factor [Ktedonobacteraceae bacterium]